MTTQAIQKNDKYNVLTLDGKKYFAFAGETLPEYFVKDGTTTNYETIESNIATFEANEDATINLSDDVSLWDSESNPYVEMIELGTSEFVGTRPVRRPNNG